MKAVHLDAVGVTASKVVSSSKAKWWNGCNLEKGRNFC